MRKTLMLGSLVALLVPSASRAQLSFGLRLGYAPAGGDFAKGDPMKEEIPSQVPFQLDAMGQMTPNDSGGFYASYGVGQVPSAVKNECGYYKVTCSAADWRVGLQATHAFNNEASTLAPWVGLGLGAEFVREKTVQGGWYISSTTIGLELNLQLGADLKMSPRLAVGPYFMLSVGRYLVESLTATPFEASWPWQPPSRLTAKGIHEWFGFGLRGKFDLLG